MEFHCTPSRHRGIAPRADVRRCASYCIYRQVQMYTAHSSSSGRMRRRRPTRSTAEPGKQDSSHHLGCLLSDGRLKHPVGPFILSHLWLFEHFAAAVIVRWSLSPRSSLCQPTELSNTPLIDWGWLYPKATDSARNYTIDNLAQ